MGQGVLGVSPATLETIAEAVGTPVYVYSSDVIRRQLAALEDALSEIPHRFFYSVKANSNGAILSLLRSLGAGADIVSGGELRRALRAGFDPRDIVFSGVGKTTVELKAALDHRIGLINVESQAELEQLEELAASVGQVVDFGIRVNPDVQVESHPYTQTGRRDMKFGVPIDEVPPLIAWAASRPALRLRSVGMHIGSQITDAACYREGAAKLARLVGSLDDARTSLTFVSVGGGLGIQYTDEPPLDVTAFAAAIRPLWEATRVPIAVEPGRVLVGNAGCLLTRCTYAKRAGTKTLLIVDAGMNDFLRPSLYGARHRIALVTKAAGGRHGALELPNRVDVVGPLCESGDTFGVDVALPGAGAGALLAILGTGAYGYSMSSTYNSRPRPAEVLLDTGEWNVVREREQLDDLMRGERLPSAGAAPRAAAKGEV